MINSLSNKETIDAYLAQALKDWPNWGNVHSLDVRLINLHQIISGLHKSCQVPHTILSISNERKQNAKFDSFRWCLEMTTQVFSIHDFSSARDEFIYVVESAYIGACEVEARWDDAVLGLYSYRRETYPGSRTYFVPEYVKPDFERVLEMTHEKVNEASWIACGLSAGLMNDTDSRTLRFKNAVRYLKDTLQLKVFTPAQAVKIPITRPVVIRRGAPAAAKIPIAVLHNVVKPPAIKGAVGTGFHDFRNGIMVSKPDVVPHKPVVVKPPAIKGAAGAGFNDFKNGIMLNDGKGDLDDRNDWLETIPTKSGNHIPAYQLVIPYKEWVHNFQYDCTMNPDFMSWLFSEFVPREEARERLYPNEYVVGPTASSSGVRRKDMLYGIKNERVTHLNKEQRKEKIKKVVSGLLVDHRGRAYHTATERTMHSGQGWAVFVMDKQNTIYAGSHTDKFLHSSFLGGDYVSSAGEIKVNNGKLVAITCKSGHYRPKKENMKYFLKNLRRRGVNLKGVGVQMGWDDTRLNSLNKRVPLLYDAAEILNGRNVIFYGVI